MIEEMVAKSLQPSVGTWTRHFILLFVTLLTSTIAGVLYPFGSIPVLPDADPQTFTEILALILSLPARYVALIGTAVSAIVSDPLYLQQGLSFSLPLVFILISHEAGHYVACRLYRVDATLPFFIPTPPMLGPAGTFGAFIKIRSPLPSRRAIFDIGVAGPIAGFLALLPIAVIGVLRLRPAPPEILVNASGITFSDPLLLRLIGYFAGIDPAASMGNPFYFAAWFGLLVTALNLIPSGQLDGGHAVYAVFGEAIHRWTGRIAFITMVVLAMTGWIFFNSPSGFLLAILLGVMMKIRHPTPRDQEPLDAKRKAVAFLTLVIFLLCFLPFPIQIS